MRRALVVGARVGPMAIATRAMAMMELWAAAVARAVIPDFALSMAGGVAMVASRDMGGLRGSRERWEKVLAEGPLTRAAPTAAPPA